MGHVWYTWHKMFIIPLSCVKIQLCPWIKNEKPFLAMESHGLGVTYNLAVGLEVTDGLATGLEPGLAAGLEVTHSLAMGMEETRLVGLLPLCVLIFCYSFVFLWFFCMMHWYYCRFDLCVLHVTYIYQS